MALIDSIDWDDYDPNADEQNAKLAGTVIPEGKYHAVLVGCSLQVPDDGNEYRELAFEILTGQFKGKVIKDKLYTKGTTEERTKTAAGRMRLFASRLGVVKKVIENGKARYEKIPGVYDFTDVHGTEVIINVVVNKFKGKDGNEVVNNRLAFEGVIALDDPAAREVARAKPGTVASTKPAAPKKPKPETDYDDIV